MNRTIRLDRLNRPLAVVLGTNEIASAIAVTLHRAGRGVVLSHDPLPPVIRRGMAFYDALFGDEAVVEDISAHRIEFMTDVFSILAQKNQVGVTTSGLTDLLVLGTLDIMVDARMQKRRVTPDFRGLANIAIGIGPGFSIGQNCDLAVETHPEKNGTVVRHGVTECADGTPSLLGGVGRDRFVYSTDSGYWHTALEIGARVYKGVVLGHHAGHAVVAPIDGVLRGLARDGTEAPAGVKLVEIDPRSGRASRWRGIDERPRQIAEATLRALRLCEAEKAMIAAKPALLIN
jgi:hypothetical protein